MAIKLPEAFLARMRELLQDEFPQFLASYEQERYFGLRINTTKRSAEAFRTASSMKLRPIPWCKEGFYYSEDERPGKQPAYHAGLYYIQEPSAMLPVELLDVRPHDKVLDLCAAPGGKSTQIAAKLNGTGLLVTNDNHAERVKPLVKNMELFGVRNAIVLNELPERLAARWPGFFDKILVDAPCSGEGMFRKEEDMIRQWERHSVERCLSMQRQIMGEVAKLVRPGGRIVYSTCTFSPEENEGVIAEFLALHPDFRLIPVPLSHGFAPGRPDWAAQVRPDLLDAAKPLAGAVRLWPHRIEGEGHFAAVLERSAEADSGEAHAWLASSQPVMKSGSSEGRGKEQPRKALRAKTKQERDRNPGGERTKDRSLSSGIELWHEFQRQYGIRGFDEAIPTLYGETLYLTPPNAPPLDGLKVARPGLHAGAVKRGRFEPAHALALALRPDELNRRIRLPADSEAVIRYLKGETLPADIAPHEIDAVSKEKETAKGYILVCMDDAPLGWAKLADGWLKNEYPPAWRWM